MARLALILSLFAVTTVADDFTKRKEYDYPLSPNGRLYLKNEVGEVRLRASDRAGIHIVAVLRARDSNEQNGPQRLAQLTLNVRSSPDEVRVMGRWPNRTARHMMRGKSKLQIDLEIEAPRSARLHIENDIGEVRIEGAGNDVIARTNVGEVSIDLADSFLPRRVYLRTRIGDVDTNLGRHGANHHMQGWLGKTFTGIFDGDRTLDVRVGIGEIRVRGGRVATQV